MTHSAARRTSRPRLRGHLAVVVGLVALFVLGTTPVFAWSVLTFSATDETQVVTLTNQARASAGVASLSVDSVLHSIAESRAKYMYLNNCLTHSSCTGGSSPVYLADLAADGYCLSNTASPNAGENIGWTNYPDDQATQSVWNFWMGSSSHKGNILQSSFTRIGVGAYKGDGRWGTMTNRGYGSQGDTVSLPAHIYVQVFAHPCSTSPTPTPKPTPTPTPKPTPTPTPKPTATAKPTPTATAKPTPTPTPRPTPTPAPGGTPRPTPTPTPPPAVTPAPTDAGPSPSPDGSVAPSASPDLGLAGFDPGGMAAGGWAVWSAWDGQPVPTPVPTDVPAPTSEPTLPPDVATSGGLAVTDTSPDLGLVDTIVGDVVSGYFGR